MVDPELPEEDLEVKLVQTENIDLKSPLKSSHDSVNRPTIESSEMKFGESSDSK